MNDLIENLRAGLDRIGELTEIVLNALSLLCIIAGIFISVMRGIQTKKHSSDLHPLHTNFRMWFGGWLVVALEFLLAADIVGTIVSPTSEHLIELGAVAVIRTFLNYFLNKELLEQREHLKIQSEKKIIEKKEAITIT